jgi:hypothetical protein
MVRISARVGLLVYLNLSLIYSQLGAHWLLVKDAFELQLQISEKVLVDDPKDFGLDIVLNQMDSTKVDPS